MGATRWEMIRVGVLRNARAGIIGAIILGLGRALGETIAVTLVIGNTPQIAKSLFAPGYTMASVIANEFSEATDDVLPQRLMEIGLALIHRDCHRKYSGPACWCGPLPEAILRGPMSSRYLQIRRRRFTDYLATGCGGAPLRHGGGSTGGDFCVPGNPGRGVPNWAF